ncbi:MAG: hypothetical protein A4E67_01415 [Syntrophaceae bacterium PtaB.Bin038]|nr:MAG: hypothetical protein A4E67_01415 [Syntrophaceae bacterium PtaB.Bin038]
MKKRDLRFGKLVVDFANAQAAEEAGVAFIRGAAKAFGYGPEFLAKALERYPTLKRFEDALPADDRELVALLLEERRLLSLINNLPCNISLASYDYDGARSLLFKIQPIEPKWDCENPYQEDDVRIAVGAGGDAWIADVAGMFDDRAPLTEDMDEVKERLLGCMREYVALGDRILAIRRASPPEKTHEARKWAAYHSRIEAEQEVLAELLERWRATLGEIVEAGDLSRCQALVDLLAVYNVVNRRELAVGEDGVIYEMPLFPEGYFTERAGLADEYYHNVLVYALVEFLKVPGNRRTLRRCPRCEAFFIAGPARTKAKKCERCASVPPSRTS